MRAKFLTTPLGNRKGLKFKMNLRARSKGSYVAYGAFSTFQPNFMVRSLNSRLLSLLLIITNDVE